MNSKKAYAGRRKPFSGFGGFRVFGSAEAESINAVSRQKTDGVISSARRRSKKEKTIALSAAGTKYAPALLSYICTAEKRVSVAGSRQYPLECGRAGGLLRLFISDAL